MFGHFGGLDRHPLQAIRNGREQAGEPLTVARVAHADDDAIGLGEHLDRASQPEILGRRGEAHPPAARGRGERLLETAHATDGELRGDQDDRAVAKVRERLPGRLEHCVDVRAILLVDRRVAGEPDHVRAGDGLGDRGRERQPLRREALADQRVEPGLGDGRPAVRQRVDRRGLGIPRRDVMAGAGHTGRDHRAEVPQTEDGDVHERESKSCGLARR
jgi:hypothetical protein